MSHGYIENEAAYEAAIRRHIEANKAKTGRRKWLAKHEDAQLLHDWLFGCGEFDVRRRTDPRCTVDEGDADGIGYWVDHWEDPANPYARCKCGVDAHPLTFYAGGDFLDKMRNSIGEWGGLTDGQHAAVARAYARALERLAGREVARTEAQTKELKSVHVGQIKERRQWVLKVKIATARPGEFGMTYFHVCHDPDGNVVVYSGAHSWERGATVRCKATVKKYMEKDGVKQTWIARPVEEN